VQAQMI